MLQIAGVRPVDEWEESTQPGPDPRAEVAREWLSLHDAQERIEAAREAAAARMAAEIGLTVSLSALDRDELKKRKELGGMCEGNDTVKVDGVTLAVSLGTKGGGNPDHKAAWGALFDEIKQDQPALAVRMMDLLKMYVTKPQLTVDIKVISRPALDVAPLPSDETREPWEVYAEQKAAPVVPIAGRPAPARKPHLQ